MRILWAVVILALAVPAGAQERGILAIGVDSALHAFSFESEADAVNMCGRTDCEVVANFDACLGVAHSRLTQHSDRSVWTWVEAATEGEAGAGALNECNAAGGIACAVVNVFCVDSEELEDALNLDRSFRRFLQQQLREAGFNPGAPDGLFGPRTRAAIRNWQAAQSVPSTGYLTRSQVDVLRTGTQLTPSVVGRAAEEVAEEPVVVETVEAEVPTAVPPPADPRRVGDGFCEMPSEASAYIVLQLGWRGFNGLREEWHECSPSGIGCRYQGSSMYAESEFIRNVGQRAVEWYDSPDHGLPYCTVTYQRPMRPPVDNRPVTVSMWIYRAAEGNTDRYGGVPSDGPGNMQRYVADEFSIPLDAPFELWTSR